MKIGIVAPSSVVAVAELKRGVSFLKKQKFEVDVHPQCRKKFLFYAGSHEERARAFYDSAMRSDVAALWFARGGYGASHLIPFLDQWTHLKGSPSKKLLVGFSDATALLEYAREVWGWSTLHAPMVSSPGLAKVADPLVDWVRRGLRGPFAWRKKLARLTDADADADADVGMASELSGVLVGGNLSVWNAQVGTPLDVTRRKKMKDRIVFLEDVSETPSRMDRAFSQLVQSGTLDGIRALVLGTFSDCQDVAPKSGSRPIRAKVPMSRALKEIFGSWGNAHRVPVWSGLPVGHGQDGTHPLPLGAKYRISPDGVFTLEDWDWTGEN